MLDKLSESCLRIIVLSYVYRECWIFDMENEYIDFKEESVREKNSNY